MYASGSRRTRAMSKSMTPSVARAVGTISASAAITSSLHSGLERILKRRMIMARSFSSRLGLVPGRNPGGVPGLDPHGRSGGVRQRRAQLPAGLEPELGEHIAQMPLDGAVAEEQLGADLQVGVSVGGEARDLCLLHGERIVARVGALARGLAGGAQLACGTLRERPGPHQRESVMGRAQLVARVAPSSLATQPLAVEQLSARGLDIQARLVQQRDRLS